MNLLEEAKRGNFELQWNEKSTFNKFCEYYPEVDGTSIAGKVDWTKSKWGLNHVSPSFTSIPV